MESGTISMNNLGNPIKYKLKTANFVGELCDHIIINTNLNNEMVYNGNLKDLDYGPIVYDNPSDWKFLTMLDGNAGENMIGKTCSFDFEFYGFSNQTWLSAWTRI